MGLRDGSSHLGHIMEGVMIYILYMGFRDGSKDRLEGGRLDYYIYYLSQWFVNSFADINAVSSMSTVSVLQM